MTVITELLMQVTYKQVSVTMYTLLGMCMCIRCLTRSTWKVQNGNAWSAGETTPCCPPPIRSRISEQRKWLGWWRASRFLSLLSCCLSSFCWAVNYNRPRSPCLRAMASWVARAKRYVNYICINPYISIANALQTDIQTYIHTYIHTYKHNLRLSPH